MQKIDFLGSVLKVEILSCGESPPFRKRQEKLVCSPEVGRGAFEWGERIW